MAILAMMGHGQDARGTSRVGTSGAGRRPNAVRPYIARKLFAKKTRIYGIAIPRRGETEKGFFFSVLSASVSQW